MKCEVGFCPNEAVGNRYFCKSCEEIWRRSSENTTVMMMTLALSAKEQEQRFKMHISDFIRRIEAEERNSVREPDGFGLFHEPIHKEPTVGGVHPLGKQKERNGK